MRKPRQKEPEAIYHVTARINRQELALEDHSLKMLFLEIVKLAKKKYQFYLKNFCIMGNHVHLDIQPQEKEDLSRIMQWILSIFARRYNKLFNYKGHVWYDRFKSRIIRTLLQYLNTFLYIANNPVRAGLVTHPLDYTCNGISYLIAAPPIKDLVHPPEPRFLDIVKKYFDKANYNQARGARIKTGYTFRLK